MLTISKPLSAGQAQRYHVLEFQNARENYYTDGDRIVGQWHGRLAEYWGLDGDVREDHFARLADGRDPLTGELLVRHQTPHVSTNNRGEEVRTLEHRAGWDATFSAPKSVSLTALVGGDERVRDAHRDSVRVALRELEAYTQARLGGNIAPETTRNWIAATFEHDSARPVDGYAAPQMHTHAVVFNLTRCENGDIRPVQPRELYRSQQFATAVYRSELGARLRDLSLKYVGEIERGEANTTLDVVERLADVLGWDPMEAFGGVREPITEGVRILLIAEHERIGARARMITTWLEALDPALHDAARSARLRSLPDSQRGADESGIVPRASRRRQRP